MCKFPTIDMVATGTNIMRLRKQAGLTVRDLQVIFGFTSPQAIYKWQNGASVPTVDNLIILSAVFNVTIDDIVVRGRQYKQEGRQHPLFTTGI